MHIRKAVSSDAATIASIHIQSWQETYRDFLPSEYLDTLQEREFESRRSRWIAQLEHLPAEKAVFVACDNDVPVGFVVAAPSRDADCKNEGEIWAIYLLKKFQGLGVGRKLLEAGFSHLRSLGLKRIGLWVIANSPTEGFYKRFNGVEMGRKIDACGAVAGIAQKKYTFVLEDIA